jgi:hypothetical protein
MIAEVVRLENPVDIVAMLRGAADRIEAGEYPDLQFITAVFVNRDSSFVTYGWGQMSTLEAIGSLARALGSDLVDE